MGGIVVGHLRLAPEEQNPSGPARGHEERYHVAHVAHAIPLLRCSPHIPRAHFEIRPGFYPASHVATRKHRHRIDLHHARGRMSRRISIRFLFDFYRISSWFLAHHRSKPQSRHMCALPETSRIPARDSCRTLQNSSRLPAKLAQDSSGTLQGLFPTAAMHPPSRPANAPYPSPVPTQSCTRCQPRHTLLVTSHGTVNPRLRTRLSLAPRP